MVGEADSRQRGGVQNPHRAAAVLHPYGYVADERVELVAIQFAGNRRVVADRPDPAVGPRFGRPQRLCQLRFGPYLRRPDRERVERGGHRPQVQMMVVKPRQYRTGVGIDHLLGGQRFETVSDIGDLLADPDIGNPAVGQHPAPNQHVASRFSINSRTRWLSAPNAAADCGGGAGIRGASPFSGPTTSGDVA